MPELFKVILSFNDLKLHINCKLEQLIQIFFLVLFDFERMFLIDKIQHVLAILFKFPFFLERE